MGVLAVDGGLVQRRGSPEHWGARRSRSGEGELRDVDWASVAGAADYSQVPGRALCKPVALQVGGQGYPVEAKQVAVVTT